MHNKNSNIQGGSPNVVKVIFHTTRNYSLVLKERIRFLWDQILFFKRSSHFEKGRNLRESLFDTVFSFDVLNFFSILGTLLTIM